MPVAYHGPIAGFVVQASRHGARAAAHRLLRSTVAVDTDRPLVSFTFDDGPDEVRTPQVLEVLRAHGARATFFVLGRRAAAAPALLRLVAAEGHEIGLHGDDHTTLADLGAHRQALALWRGRRAVASAAGRPPALFRAPYGLQTPTTVALARSLRLRPVMWSAHAAEWDGRPVPDCVREASPGLVPGGIVLLHDGHAGRRPARDLVDVLALLEALLVLAEARGLTVVPVGELLASGRPRSQAWFRSWRVSVGRAGGASPPGPTASP